MPMTWAILRRLHGQHWRAWCFRELGRQPQDQLRADTPTHRLAPTLVMFACFQTFGRAASHSVLPNPPRLTRFRGFLRFNTSVFIGLTLLAYFLALIGDMMVIGTVPATVVTKGHNVSTVRAAYGVVEGSLALQSVLLIVFAVLVARWKTISRDWDVEWDDMRRMTWTWKKLLQTVLTCVGLLMVSAVERI